MYGSSLTLYSVMQQIYFSADCRAFSDLFEKFLVPMKLGKKCVILGKNTSLGKNSAIFSKIGKFYLINWDFSAHWQYFR